MLSCNSLNARDISPSDTTKKKFDFTILAFYQQGKVLPTNDFVKGDNIMHIPINSFRAVSLQFFKQTAGEKLWEQLYGFPRFGISIYNARFIDAKEIGNPIAVYGSLGIPLFRVKNFSLFTNVGFGLTFNWESYGEDRFNIALGAEESVYIDLGPSIEYKINKSLLIDVGISFTHFSNGNLKSPNFGLNTFAPKLSFGYNFNRPDKGFKYQIVPAFKKKSDIFISLYGGLENILYYGHDVDSVTKNKGVYYPTYGFSGTYNRQVSYKSKFGIGLMVDYLGAAHSSIKAINGKLEDIDASLRKGIEFSVYPSYELLIDRLSLLIQPGFYLYRTKYKGRSPGFYQRIGIKYDVIKNLSMGINLRAYDFQTSQFIEWTMAYRLKL
jgi:hypothetical protein